jgi:multidrug resistance efflux pump
MVDFRRRYVPVLVWFVVLGLVASILAGRVRRQEFIGLAQALQYRISAPIAGRIDSVLVRELDAVNPGDVVARLDGSALEARKATELAQARQLTARLAAERSRLTAGAGLLSEGYSMSLRRFRMDEEERSLSALSLRVLVEGDLVEQERLHLEAERAEQLLSKGLVSEAERDLAVLSHRRIAERVEHNQDLLLRTEEEQRQAAGRRQQFESEHTGEAALAPALTPLIDAIRVQESRLEELRVEQSNLLLRSPVAGEVSQILCRKGQAIAPGEPVVVIAERVPGEILAYLPEVAAGRLRPNSAVAVSRRADPSRTAESRVTRVGAAIEPIPQQLWRDPRIPEYGLTVAIAMVPALTLTPGEVVFVRSAAPG